MATNGQLDYYSHARSSTLHLPRRRLTSSAFSPPPPLPVAGHIESTPGGLSAEPLLLSRGPAGSPDTCLLQVDLGHAAVYVAMPLAWIANWQAAYMIFFLPLKFWKQKEVFQREEQRLYPVKIIFIGTRSGHFHGLLDYWLSKPL